MSWAHYIDDGDNEYDDYDNNDDDDNEYEYDDDDDDDDEDNKMMERRVAAQIRRWAELIQGFNSAPRWSHQSNLKFQNTVVMMIIMVMMALYPQQQ